MIREFDLDASYADPHLRRQLRKETRCVTALVERHYKPTKNTGKAWKFMVELVDRDPRDKTCDVLGVIEVQIATPLAAFLMLSPIAKKRATLDLLVQGFALAANERSWDRHSFDVAVNAALAADLVNKWKWRSRVWNPQRTVTAELWIHHDIDSAEFTVRFTEAKGKRTSEVHLATFEPDEFLFVPQLGSLLWLDDRTVELISRDSSQSCVATIPP